MSHLLGHCACGRKKKNTFETYERSRESILPDIRSYASVVWGDMEFAADPTHYRLLVIIGRGSNDRATIYLAEHLPSKSQVTIRIVKADEYAEDFNSLQLEIRAAKQLQHANLLPYLATFVHHDQIWVVMPMMGYGSCKDLIHAHFDKGLPEQAIAMILRDVLQAVDYLHCAGHIHRSIRASHVLVSGEGHVCLTGLRASTTIWWEGKKLQALHKLPPTSLLSTNWLAPEVLEQNLEGYGTKSDIYSLGILSCEIANGVEPFANMAPTQMLLEKVYGSMPQLIDSTTACIQLEPSDSDETDPLNEGEVRTVPVDRTFTPEFHDLVRLCLQRDPDDRPTAAQLLCHPFFKQIRRRSLEQLPQLLLPVSPLQGMEKISISQTTVDELARDIEYIRFQDFTWAF